MDLAPQRPLGNAHRPRELRIEAPLPFLLDERVAQGPRAAVVDRERHDRVILSSNNLSRVQLFHLDWKGETIHSVVLGALHRALCSAWSPDAQRVYSPLQRHGAKQPDDADHMIG